MRLSSSQYWDCKRRDPIRFSEPPTQKSKRKWDKIIDGFMDGRIDELKQIYRTVTRGRIFEVLLEMNLTSLKSTITRNQYSSI